MPLDLEALKPFVTHKHECVLPYGFPYSEKDPNHRCTCGLSAIFQRPAGPTHTISGGLADRITAENVFEILAEEVGRARTKHPVNSLIASALVEEVGEMLDDALNSSSNYRVEALQVACVAIRIVLEGMPLEGEDLQAIRDMVKMGKSAKKRLTDHGDPL